MESNVIHIIYHPSALGYAAYSRELDGMVAEATNLDELFDKIKYLLKVRIESLKEIGKNQEAENLQQKELIFVEE